MRLIPFLILAAVATTFAGCWRIHLPPDPDPNTNGRTLSFQTIEISAGYGSSIVDRGQVEVTNEAQWRELWDRAHSGMIPQPELPAVDFSRSTVIALFQGLKNSGGYTIEVKKVSEENGSTTVAYDENVPGAGCGVTAALTTPLHIIRIDQHLLPVRYSGRTLTTRCE